MRESHSLAERFVFRKFIRMYVTGNREMFARGLKVLPECEDIRTLSGEIAHLLSDKVWEETRFWDFVNKLKAQRPIWTTRNTEAMVKLSSGEGYVGTGSYAAIEELKAASLEASAAIGARLTVLLAELARDR